MNNIGSTTSMCLENIQKIDDKMELLSTINVALEAAFSTETVCSLLFEKGIITEEEYDEKLDQTRHHYKNITDYVGSSISEMEKMRSYQCAVYTSMTKQDENDKPIRKDKPDTEQFE